MPTYQVQSNLDYDGQRYVPGETVALPAEIGAPLVELAVLAEAKPATRSAAKSTGRARKSAARKS